MLIRFVSLMTVVSVCFLFVISPVIAAPDSGEAAGTLHGKVTEVIEAAGYTYVEIDTGTKKAWAAGPNTQLKIGDKVGFATDMAMANFHSKSLQRDFDVVYFVDAFIIDGKPSSTSAAQVVPVAKPLAGIAALSDGQTIAEVHAEKQRLKDQVIRVRGRVTKFTAGIMGKNWVHIMDSSSGLDLTMTLAGSATVDDVVVIEGRLTLDRDFGYGYFYPIIVEDGKVTKE